MNIFYSKIFRKNLKKWLIMYFIALAFITTVITYSKYISSIKSQDSARVAKFNIEITPAKPCTNLENKICNTGAKRPTGEIEYYFNVSTNLEVKTNLFLTLYINKTFDYQIYEVTNEKLEKVLASDTTVEGNPIPGSEVVAKSWSTIIPAGTKTNQTYKIVVKYPKPSDGIYKTNNEEYKVIKVNYSAIQIK